MSLSRRKQHCNFFTHWSWMSTQRVSECNLLYSFRTYRWGVDASFQSQWQISCNSWKWQEHYYMVCWGEYQLDKWNMVLKKGIVGRLLCWVYIGGTQRWNLLSCLVAKRYLFTLERRFVHKNVELPCKGFTWLQSSQADDTIQTGSCTSTLVEHAYTVSALAWMPNGKMFVSAGMDAKLYFWVTFSYYLEWSIVLISLSQGSRRQRHVYLADWSISHRGCSHYTGWQKACCCWQGWSPTFWWNSVHTSCWSWTTCDSDQVGKATVDIWCRGPETDCVCSFFLGYGNSNLPVIDNVCVQVACPAQRYDVCIGNWRL